MTVTITGTNDGPVAVADVAAGNENQTLTIDVLANDTDVDDGHASADSGSCPGGKGSVNVVGNQLVFDPGTRLRPPGGGRHRGGHAQPTPCTTSTGRPRAAP